MAIFLTVMTIGVSSVVVVDYFPHVSSAADNVLAGRFTGRDQASLEYLDIRFSPAKVTLVGALDPLKVCDGRSMPYLIGAAPNGTISYVLVLDATNHGRVVRLPFTIYLITSGLSDSAPCSKH
jgi:TctA family transporter